MYTDSTVCIGRFLPHAKAVPSKVQLGKLCTNVRPRFAVVTVPVFTDPLFHAQTV
jgi:hypothetical protein